MNKEDFIGLDIARAIHELDNFNDGCRSFEASLTRVFIDLFEVLYDRWASPNAVFFCNKEIPHISEVMTSYIGTYKNILSSANYAGIILARAHGSSMPAKYVNQSGGQFNLGVNGCEETKNGVTGMDKEKVTIALNAFIDESNKALNILRSVPSGISFYDSAGHLLNTYRKGINEFVETFNQTISSITSELKTYIEIEIENIELAKEKAQEELNS